MKPLVLSEVIQAINGSIFQGDEQLPIRRVVKQLKNINENTLYFHLSGKEIPTTSLDGKINYAIVTNSLAIVESVDEYVSVIFVSDVKNAYWNFINYYRNLFQIPVIGVTGTCGKTTTKDMIAHMLKKDLKVHKTLLSQNGLHLNLHYLMGINDETEAAVFEMGVAYPGNIRSSGKYFKPTVGVITNIGEAHLEGCKTLDKYIKAKGELLEVLSSDGTLIINQDDDNSKRVNFKQFKGKLITTGIQQPSDYQAKDIEYRNDGMIYSLIVNDQDYRVYVPGYGEHNVYNSLQAIAATHHIGFPIEKSLERLKTYQTMQRHTKIYHGFNGCQIIDDTWSCNPSSVQSGLNVLKSISNGKKEVLVLGKMQRLGSSLKTQHQKLGQKIIDNGGIHTLITIGSAAKITAEKALQLGMPQANVHNVSNAKELEQILAQICNKDTIVLFKMSLGKMDSTYRAVVEKYRKNTD